MDANNADRVRGVGGRARGRGRVRVGGGVQRGARGGVERGGRGGRGQFGQGRGGGQRLGTRRVVSGEIRATIIDHVINHGLTM